MFYHGKFIIQLLIFAALLLLLITLLLVTTHQPLPAQADHDPPRLQELLSTSGVPLIQATM